MGTFSIVQLKEKSATYQPLLLAEFTFSDGSVARFCTHALNTTGGNFQYNGNDYLARITAQDIQPIGASQQGISMPQSASITLADDDRFIYQNYEVPLGFGGAQMLLRFVFWNAGTASYSSDCSFPFVGICSQPGGTDTDLKIQAVSLVNMTGTKFPTTLVQRLCPNQFPATATQRQDGADNPDSWYYPCGYSPDATGANKCGNYQTGTTPYVTCGYTKDDCVKRGMYAVDSLSRTTGRFAGFQWDPPSYVRSEGYIDSNWIDVFSDPNVAKYGQPIPMIYGTQWVQGLVLHTAGDANSTRAEIILCAGRISGILALVCNGETIPASSNPYGTDVPDPLFRYSVVNNGQRSGTPCPDAGFGGKGDPMGSTCVVEVVVPRSLVASPSAPNVQALIAGPLIVNFAAVTRIVVASNVATATIATPIADASFNSGFQVNIIGNQCAALNAVWQIAGNHWSSTTLTWTTSGIADGTYTGGFVRFRGYTANPVWVLYDLLSWGGWGYSSLDLSTFVAVASYCQTAINYTESDGVTIGSHPRFQVGWAVTQQRTLGEAVRDVLGSFNGMLCPSPTTGLLELHTKQTLADQQPAPIVGSNYLTPIPSVTVAGVAANGYAAYSFDVSSILRQDKKAQFNLIPRANSDLQNSYSVAFQDSENSYVADTYEVTDTAAVNRMGQLLNATLPGLPPTTYDQARRLANQLLGETLRSNARLDPSGSTRIEITTTFKAVHLRYGHIVLLTWNRMGISNQLFRVISVQPTTNWETAKITLQWHEDAVWTDAYGQGDIPASRTANAGRAFCAPYPPLVGRGWDPAQGIDALRPDEHGFYATWADASWATSTNRTARFWCFPTINSFSSIAPPRAPLIGSSASAGGVLAGGKSYWIWIVAEDANALLTIPSMSRVDVPAGTNTNALTLFPVIFDSAAVAYHVWLSDTPARPYYYGRVSGVTSNITLTSGLASQTHNQIPIPDPALAAIRLKMKRILIAGAWEGLLTAATTLTLTCTGAGWTTNQWAGRIVTMVGRANPTARIDMPPNNSWLIVSNTSDTLTLQSGGADPSTLLTSAYSQCYIVIRCQATAATASTITDTALNMTVGTQQGRVVRIIKGTGVGQTAAVASNTTNSFTVTPSWGVTPDTTSVFLIEEPAWMSQTDYRIRNDRWDYVLNIFGVQYAFDITGLAKTHLLFQPLGVNSAGKETTEDLAYPAISDLYFMLDIISEAVIYSSPKLNGISMWVNGALSNNLDATNHLTMPATQSLAPTGATATLKSAPSGSSVVAVVKVNGAAWLTFTLAPGATSVTLSSATVLAAGPVPASAVITLSITATSGSDLAISIWV